MSKINLTIEVVRESAFYKSRPKEIQELIDKVPPTHHYKINDTGHVCTIYSYQEDVHITVLREVNDLDKMNPKLDPKAEYLNVFGLKPEDVTILPDQPLQVEEGDIESEKIIVVKIQRSLAGSEEQEMVLIYDEAREFMYEGPMPSDVRRLMGDKEKIYAEAIMNPDEDQAADLEASKFSIVHVIEDQEW